MQKYDFDHTFDRKRDNAIRQDKALNMAKLDTGLRAEGSENVLERLFLQYVEASNGEDETQKQAILTDILAAEYRRIVYGN